VGFRRGLTPELSFGVAGVSRPCKTCQNASRINGKSAFLTSGPPRTIRASREHSRGPSRLPKELSKQPKEPQEPAKSSPMRTQELPRACRAYLSNRRGPGVHFSSGLSRQVPSGAAGAAHPCKANQTPIRINDKSTFSTSGLPRTIRAPRDHSERPPWLPKEFP
jgi:hypothetical protein